MGGPPDMGGPIQDKLESMAGEMASVMDEQLKVHNSQHSSKCMMYLLYFNSIFWTRYV